MIAIFGKGKIGEPLEKLLQHCGIEAQSIDYNEWDDELFTSAEQIIVHQAVKPDAGIYKKYGSKTISELNFIGQLLKKQARGENLHFIGVTGTDGKSTTCYILYELLKRLNTGHTIRISGNFDESVATTLNHIIDKWLTDQKHIIVTELSSFLLYNLEDLRFDYSIRTNISPDHLNRHPDMKHYVQTKYWLFTHSTKGVFTTQGVLDTLAQLSIPLTHTAPLTIYDNDYSLDNTQFVGAHNSGNLQVCYLVAKSLLADMEKLPDETAIRQIMGEITPLAHRIELINEKGGIKFYDDGKATSSQALRVALEAFPWPLVLIAGGSDKGDNFTALSDLLKQKASYGVFIGTTAPQFAAISDTKGIPYANAASMEEAVRLAYAAAQKHSTHVVILSPGCASLDMFSNYLERSHKYADAVQAL